MKYFEELLLRQIPLHVWSLPDGNGAHVVAIAVESDDDMFSSSTVSVGVLDGLNSSARMVLAKMEGAS